MIIVDCPNCHEKVELIEIDSQDDRDTFYGECKCEYYFNFTMIIKDEFRDSKKKGGEFKDGGSSKVDTSSD